MKVLKTLRNIYIRKKGIKERRERLFRRVCCDRTRENGFKLQDGKLRSDIRKKFLTLWVMRHTRCPERWWASQPWRQPRSGWRELWATWSNCGCPWSLQGSCAGWPSRVPFRIKLFYFMTYWMKWRYLIQHGKLPRLWLNERKKWCRWDNTFWFCTLAAIVAANKAELTRNHTEKWQVVMIFSSYVELGLSFVWWSIWKLFPVFHLDFRK